MIRSIIARITIIINSGVSYRTLQMSSRESPYRASPCDRTITSSLIPPLHWSCSSRPLTLSLSLSLSLFSSFSSLLLSFPPPPPPILHHSVFLPTKSHSFFRFCLFNPWPVGCHSLGGSLIPVHSLNRSHKKRSSSTGCFPSFLSLACAVYRLSSHLSILF